MPFFNKKLNLSQNATSSTYQTIHVLKTTSKNTSEKVSSTWCCLWHFAKSFSPILKNRVFKKSHVSQWKPKISVFFFSSMATRPQKVFHQIWNDFCHKWYSFEARNIYFRWISAKRKLSFWPKNCWKMTFFTFFDWIFCIFTYFVLFPLATINFQGSNLF